MKYEPYPHAVAAQAYQQVRPRCALWLEMGLHKTVITLTTLAHHFDQLNLRRALVVAPKRVSTSVWPVELQKWDHLSWLRWQVLANHDRHRIPQLRDPTIDLDITNYEKLIWVIGWACRERGRTGRWPWDCIVLDEASKLKAPDARRYRMLRPQISRFKHVYQLAGSPSPNGLRDVWGPMHLLDPEDTCDLGETFEMYQLRFFRRIPGQWRPVIEDGADDIIHRKVSSFAMSMRSVDHVQLPPRLDVHHEVELPEGRRRDYRKLENDMFLQLEDHEITAINGGVLIGKCQQFANGAIYKPLVEDQPREWTKVHDHKLDVLDDIIEEAAGNPVLVAYLYKHDYERIAARFRQAVHLGTDPAIIEQWNAGEIPLLCLHPASAGHGLNLQHGGNRLVWFGLPWSYELYEQTNARLLRTGQEAEHVYIHHIRCRRTVEDEVLVALTQKKAVQDALLDAVKLDPSRRAA